MGVGEIWCSNPSHSVPLMQEEEASWYAESVATNEMHQASSFKSRTHVVRNKL